MEQEKVWDAIGEPWQDFRKRNVSETIEFLEGKSGKVLDLGCGSGRNFIKNDKLKFYGVDFSKTMLKLAEDYAKKEGIDFEVVKSSADKIPFDDEFFDVGIYSAALHCVDSEERRLLSVKELFRVLKTGGEAIISVWGKKQKRIKNKDKECFIPWTVGDKKYERYTYIFDKDELENLLESVGFKIVKSWEDRNVNVIVRKG